MPETEAALAAIREAVGTSGWTDDPQAMAPHLSEWRGRFTGRASMVVRPADTGEVAAVLALCNRAAIGVVPQGGNTGLCGGAVPDASGRQIVLSLQRMHRVLDVDPRGYTLTAQAGCVLADLQRAAADVNRLFALSLAAEGSCQIGGNVATNAGGTNVLRYGTMRDQLLGLEVVLPDGRTLDALRGLRKDTAGYDLKQLFVGSEGTLGVITAVCCRLYPRPAETVTAMAAVASPAAALDLLALLRERVGDNLTAFELMPRRGLELVVEHVSGCRDPFPQPHPWYVLMDCASHRAEHDTGLLEALEQTMAAGGLSDAVVAAAEGQRRDLWRLRDSLSAAQKRAGPSIKHDVSLPLGRMARFIDRGAQRVQALLPGAAVLAFGHVGDGNVHFNVSPPAGMSPDRFLQHWQRVAREVHDLATGLGGSFSAEHGVGQLKVDELARLRGGVELATMRALKQVFDPKGIMNPGKVL